MTAPDVCPRDLGAFLAALRPDWSGPQVHETIAAAGRSGVPWPLTVRRAVTAALDPHTSGLHTCDLLGRYGTPSPEVPHTVTRRGIAAARAAIRERKDAGTTA